MYEKDEVLPVRKSTKITNVNRDEMKGYLETNYPPSIDDIDENKMVNIFYEEAERVMKMYRRRNDVNDSPL